MPTLRVPVFAWRDFSNQWTATPVDLELLPEEFRYAAASTLSESLKAVAETIRLFVNKERKENGSLTEIEPAKPEVQRLKFKVRPRYERQGRAYPARDPVEFQLPATIGATECGAVHCTVPTIGLVFRCFEGDDFQAIASEKVRSLLDGLSPAELLKRLPPLEWQLKTVSVPVKDASQAREELKHPALEQVAKAIGLSEFRKLFTAAYQRNDELKALAGKLQDREANIAIVGPPGVGKTTLLVAAARSIERNSKDEQGPRNRFWLTSASRLIAGARYLGEWEEQVERVLQEIASFDGVLCIENLIDLVRLGGGAVDNIASFMTPYLENGRIRIAGEATPHEMDALRRLAPSFIDKFQVLPVTEMTLSTASLALGALAEQVGRDGRLTFEPEAISRITRLYDRFQPYKKLPGSAAGAVYQLADEAKQNNKTTVTPQDVLRRFLEETGLPEWLLRDEETVQFEDVVQELGKSVIGQRSACELAARSIVRFKAGMNHPGRPIGSMLFCGPTGVGKTQLAKTMTDYLFGGRFIKSQAGTSKSPTQLVRLDMSEYATPWSAQRIVEKDDGRPSDFIEQIRRHPFSVVLLDEIEKAAPEVFDMLLALLDEGRLTDRLGRTTNFESTVIIMTSNLGANNEGSTGFASGESSAHLRAVREFFRPEFFNRIDATVQFSPLNHDVCRLIVKKELESVSQRSGMRERGLSFLPTDALIEHLIDVGFDVRYGARPLQRAIETEVVSVISRYLTSIDFLKLKENPSELSQTSRSDDTHSSAQKQTNHELLADWDPETGSVVVA
jgi:ATP-dependent Clp protease ATP-binding subunit ClpC